VEKDPHAVSFSEAKQELPEFQSGKSTEADIIRRRDAFARLFAKHDRWMYSYLVTLLGSTAHAEEVFQEVCVVLWREYETFELGTDFVRWVAVIAHNQVRKFRRQRRQVGFQLSDATFDLLAAEAVDRVDLFDYRRDALRRCLTKLSAADRALIVECYQERKVNFKATAHRLGRPENTVYKALNRIRRVLFECINRALLSEGLL
jgi:RNA polymerase sigma-70 factor, ECF subfamily